MTLRVTVLSAIGAALLAAPSSFAQVADISPELAKADIVFLGEQHDNPYHHAVQSHYVGKLQPTAIVFEMLTADQAALVTPELRADAVALEAALQWEASGWPDFSMYYPIFSAAPAARIFGASVPREQLRSVIMGDWVGGADPALVSRFGLDRPLPAAQQNAREALQRESHCNALPEEMLPGMVNAQRLRDAALASAALDAWAELGGPVVVITGNGHARTDWGAPYLVGLANAEADVFVLGQGEEGQAPPGVFSQVQDSPGVDRGDPCAAFK